MGGNLHKNVYMEHDYPLLEDRRDGQENGVGVEAMPRNDVCNRLAKIERRKHGSNSVEFRTPSRRPWSLRSRKHWLEKLN